MTEETTIIDGWLMKKVGTYLSKSEAYLAALGFRRKMHLARVVPGEGRWTVFATIESVRTQVRMKA